jgi:hypothetical protein
MTRSPYNQAPFQPDPYSTIPASKTTSATTIYQKHFSKINTPLSSQRFHSKNVPALAFSDCEVVQWSRIFTYARNILILNLSGKSQSSSITANGDDKYAIFNAYLRLRTTWLYDLVELNLSFQRDAAKLSWGISLKPQIRVKDLPLRSFFADIYGCSWKRPLSVNLPSRPKQEHLAFIAQKLLLQAFSSGNASPGDVDALGQTFIHVNVLAKAFKGHEC